METRPGMTAPLRHPTGSGAAPPAPGGPLPDAVRIAVDTAREWAGDELVALLLSGSHATGEAVWIDAGGRAVTLSDVDLYAAMRDEAACRSASSRSRAGRPEAAARLREAGLEAPLEVGFLTLEGLSRMPAKPGTIELARHGIAVAGDAAALSRVPRWEAADVPAEEVSLLLENRGLELLSARPLLDSPDPLERARGRHGTLKAAADLATVLALPDGRLPDGTRARVEAARGRLAALADSRPPADLAGVRVDLERLWAAAIAWRAGAAAAAGPGEGLEEWRAAARAWCAVWWSRSPGPSGEAWERARRSAARAPLPRRLRRGLAGAGGPSPRRLRLALAGTPQHRLGASAAVLLFAAAGDPAPALPPGARRALHDLGICGAADWDGARLEALRAWDRIVLGGQRGDDTP